MQLIWVNLNVPEALHCYVYHAGRMTNSCRAISIRVLGSDHSEHKRIKCSNPINLHKSILHALIQYYLHGCNTRKSLHQVSASLQLRSIYILDALSPLEVSSSTIAHDRLVWWPKETNCFYVSISHKSHSIKYESNPYID